MRIYLITDTHFYHKHMVQYCGRPENFTEIIAKNLVDLNLEEDDILIHLGDICIGWDELAHEKFIRPLKCKKWLLRGNHDNKSYHWYLNHGWDWVGETMTGVYFGKKICFSHIPQYYQEAANGENTYDINIHGHFHNDAHRSSEKAMESIKNFRQKLLAIEYTDLKPVLLEDFIHE